ncbi:hypothetical protein [Streptomyces sp. NPDC007088]|uniref:hypothetical protein n=1 Tax=Streptomyces sp. NPDC007088 TaxID=3364773 RepID=UPI0036B53900
MAGLLSTLVRARRSGGTRPGAVVPSRSGRGGDSGLPGPDAGPSDGESGRGGTASTTATQRVRLIVEGADDPDEVERAVEALGAQPGWKVRPSRRRDGLRPAEGRVVLVVDALAYGQRKTAVGAVRTQAAGLLSRPPVGFRIREAELVRHEKERDTALVRVVRRTPPDSGTFHRWLWRHLEALGAADTGHVLTVPLAAGESGEQLKARVKEEWADLTHSGAAFDDEHRDLRLTVGPRPRTETGGSSPARARFRRFEGPAWSLLGVLVPLACAWTLAVPSSPWRFLALLAPLASFGPVGYWITANESRPRLVRLGCGAFLVGGLTGVSYQWLENSPDGFGAQVRGLLLALLIMVTAVGCWHAFSRSWLSRNLLILLPLLIAPLPFVLPWVGSFLHTAYLEEVMGIPEPAVHIAFYWRYFVALEPVALTLAITLFYVSLYGWAKYFNLHVSQGAYLNVIFSFLVLLAVLAVSVRTMNEAETAGERTYRAAMRGERPPEYFGIKGRLVCLRPVEPGKRVSVQPGPLPTSRPVLTFPRQGDDLWVWDTSPKRGHLSTDHAVRMRAEDVSLYPATGTTCP